MGIEHLVRTGMMGVVSRFDTPDFNQYSRDTPVIVRTDRGLEVGTVICDLSDAVSDVPMSGTILRKVSAEDRMILERLERFRDKAFVACEQLIKERGLKGTLVDVEHSFDGESVYFYFLGGISPELESLTHELGELYERKVRFKKFAETLTNGCGPGCGTEASKCSTGGCGSCAVSGACGSKKK